MLLVGDVGGTKTILALCDRQDEGWVRVREQRFASGAHPSLESVIRAFLAPVEVQVEAACFGVAGPVFEGRSRITNLSWMIDEATLSIGLGGAKVCLLNDLQAMAMGLLALGPEDWYDFNPSARKQAGNQAVIAAGTGLGEAILFWDGERHHPIATEGGHASFAPSDEFEDALIQSLRRQGHRHVSVERLLSGSGIWLLYQHLRSLGSWPESEALAEALRGAGDPAPVISRFALQGQDVLAMETLRRFARIYGAEAGNLALRSLAVGGLLLGGGIAPQILPALIEDDRFMSGFLAKEPFGPMLREIPVRVALNPATALLGAIQHGARHLLGEASTRR